MNKEEETLSLIKDFIEIDKKAPVDSDKNRKDPVKIAKDMVKKAEDIAQNDILSISTSQLRNVFGAIKKLEMTQYDEKVFRQLILIKPKLAYMRGRSGGKQDYQNLEKILVTAIDAVYDETSFKRFCEFIEAILAYHKVYGDK